MATNTPAALTTPHSTVPNYAHPEFVRREEETFEPRQSSEDPAHGEILMHVVSTLAILYST